MRILYIEDELLTNKDCIRAVMCDANKSKWVKNTRSALAELNSGAAFQVVLCDCILRDDGRSPDEQYEGGIDFLRQVRRKYPQNCPLLILFSSRQDLPEEQLKRENIFVIEKHRDPDLLFRQIEALYGEHIQKTIS